MKYNEVFAISETEFRELSESEKEIEDRFELNNHSYYEPKLESEFYLKSFIKKTLFQIDILDLQKFLMYHFDYCENPQKYYAVLEYKVIPKTQEFIDHATMFFSATSYTQDKKLDKGFEEKEGIIKSHDYKYTTMSHRTAFCNLQNDLAKRIQIIELFIEDYKGEIESKPLKWLAGPSQMGVVFSELVNKGYIATEEIGGETNIAHFTRMLNKIFDCKKSNSLKGLEIYLSPNNQRNIKAKAKFDDLGFKIPDAKFT